MDCPDRRLFRYNIHWKGHTSDRTIILMDRGLNLQVINSLFVSHQQVEFVHTCQVLSSYSCRKYNFPLLQVYCIFLDIDLNPKKKNNTTISHKTFSLQFIHLYGVTYTFRGFFTWVIPFLNLCILCVFFTSGKVLFCIYSSLRIYAIWQISGISLRKNTSFCMRFCVYTYYLLKMVEATLISQAWILRWNKNRILEYK